MPELSVIIPTYNSIQFIKPCLDSVYQQGVKDAEIIVIDNGSIDGTTGFIKQHYPSVILIENSSNLGAAHARNQGIDISNGKWILCLDSDVVLEAHFLKNLLTFAHGENESVGSFQPKILALNTKKIYSCGISLSPLRRFFDIGKGNEDHSAFHKPRFIMGPCSAAALYKRKMLRDIKESTGYFDKRFFFLVEDVDLAWRAQRKGWKSLFYADAVCYHHGNSSKSNKKLRQYLCFRNRHLMIAKNEKLLSRVVLYMASFWYEIPRFLYIASTNKYLYRK